MHAHKMTSLYYLLCQMQSADQCTAADNMLSLDCYSLLQSIIAPVFEHCVLCGQRGKNNQFSWLWDITGSKRRLDRPILWRSRKLFTTNQCFATTTRNMQNSNTNAIDYNIITAVNHPVFIACSQPPSKTAIS